MINEFGKWWLSGPKYELSKMLAGPMWNKPLDMMRDPSQKLEWIIGRFRSLYYIPDPWWQLQDQVFPPNTVVERGGGDCDDWAMTHATAVHEALGWPSFIVSYLADPWWKSHHFAVVQQPDGNWWAIQPQNEKGKPYINPILGPFKDINMALDYVAGCYKVKVVWHDVRKYNYDKLDA